MFELVDRYAKVNQLYDIFTGSLNEQRTGADDYLNTEYPFGWTNETEISGLDVLAHPEAMEKLKKENEMECAYVVRCQAGLLESMFVGQPHPSTMNPENYKLENAKATEAEIALKPNILALE